MKIKNILILLIAFLVLWGAYFVTSRIKAYNPGKPVVYLWDIKDNDLSRIKIALPREKKSQSFIKITDGDKFPWFFDDRKKSPINTERWGGGIPLILSGPGADRIILENATKDQLNKFGLDRPSMEITLTLSNKEKMMIRVGNSTPDGNNYYVKAPVSQSVATVDSSWYTVLKNLVSDPPHFRTKKDKK